MDLLTRKFQELLRREGLRSTVLARDNRPTSETSDVETLGKGYSLSTECLQVPGTRLLLLAPAMKRSIERNKWWT